MFFDRAGDRTFVVAEIGKNFITSADERPVAEYLEHAKHLVAAAKAAGADAVKFQTHEVEDEQLNVDVTSPHFTGADRFSWVTRNTRSTPMDAFWRPLKQFCDAEGITFFSTPMSRAAAHKLIALDVPLWKIGSGDVQDFVLLDAVCARQQPVMIATGMVGHAELADVVRFVAARRAPLAVLYCISKYPCPAKEFNLGTIELLRERYPSCAIGFSDHSLGWDVDLAAVQLGAQIIEKHFSFDRAAWGSDHKVSMTPDEMRVMVSAIRSGVWRDVDVAPYYGDKMRELEGATNAFRPYFNKSLVAGRDLPAGTVLTADVLYAMRPQMVAGGLHAERYEEVLGRRLTRALRKYESITEDVLDVLARVPV